MHSYFHFRMTIADAAAYVQQQIPAMKYSLSPLKLEAWRELLQGYPDQAEANLTLRGIVYGERIGYKGTRTTFIAPNPQHSEPERRQIQKDADTRRGKGYVLGPFPKQPCEPMQTSPSYSIPKGENDCRIIHDLSFPRNRSINDGIDITEFEVKLDTVSDAMVGIREAHKRLQPGQKLLAMKFDWADAFRHVCLAPIDIPLVSFRIDNYFYLDTRLPFGARSSPSIFCRYTQQMKWIAKEKFDIDYLFNFYDDFFSLGFSEGDQNAYLIDQKLQELCVILGVTSKPSKHVPPTSCITYLGIEFDLEKFEARIPLAKVNEVLEKVRGAFTSSHVTVRIAQSLLGSLVFICCIVLPGRSFVSRIIARIKVLGPLPAKDAKIIVDRNFRCDLRFFMRFLPIYNGVSIILDSTWSSMIIEVDASSWGAGGFCGENWFSLQWSHQEKAMDISLQEMVAIILACKAFGHLWVGLKVTVRSDNQAVCSAVHSRRVRDPLMMNWIRELHFLEATGNFLVRARHVPGVENVLADKLSRNRIEGFHRSYRERFNRLAAFSPTLVSFPSLTPEDPNEA